MSPTSLVAETVMRLMKQRKKPLSEDHLRGLATVFMVRVLSDARRARLAKRRGGGKPAQFMTDSIGDIHVVGLGKSAAAVDSSGIDGEGLLEAMGAVAETHPREMEVVTLHLVADIPLPRVAKLMELGERTVYRDLQTGCDALAKWLRSKRGRKT